MRPGVAWFQTKRLGSHPGAVWLRALLVLAPTVLFGACGGSPSSSSPPPTLSVAPTSLSLELGAAATTFVATPSGLSDTQMSWEVDGVVGGNATVGTISASGVYQAPVALPTNPTITITAVSVAAPALSASATVTLVAPPLSVAVLPPGSAIEAGGVATTFTAVVLNATNPAVSWRVNGVEGGSEASGTISATGLYVSPPAVPNPATITVSAVSVEDPTRSGATVVTLTPPPGQSPPPPPPVTVSVAPALATVSAGGAALGFTASVANSSNTTVRWAVNGVAGGDATVGTISTAGRYTPPVTAPAGVLSITATAAANPAAVGTALVTVTPKTGAAPLTISGAPATSIPVGTAFSFTPTVSAPTGATLAYSIQSKPPWAVFSTTTGRLSGKPTASQIGAYEGIVISVSDGASSAALPAFNLTVRPADTGTATVHWLPPTTAANGAPLTGLAGFWIYYGTTPTALVDTVQVPNPTVTSYELTGLKAATYYFAASAYDSNGVQSVRTAPVSKTIP